MKTVLNITKDHLSDIEQYCEKSLIEEIFEDFSKIGQVIISEKLELNINNIWDISKFIVPNTLCDRKKLAVIFSYARLGVIKFENWENWGTVNAIIELYEIGCISEEDFDYFCQKFYNFSNQSGDTSKFK